MFFFFGLHYLGSAQEGIALDPGNCIYRRSDGVSHNAMNKKQYQIL
jgi:hypothetical protein